MQALHQLIHSLSKDEKRLYHQHRRNTRLRPIYDAYLKATAYSRELDKMLYQEHFQKVSRAFYSMLKRELQEEIVTILLEYTNSQKSTYQFARSYARALVLMNRDLKETAADYLKEAQVHAREMHSRADQLRVLNLEKDLATDIPQQDLNTFQQLLELENKLQNDLEVENQLKNTRIALNLLKRQVGVEPGLSHEEIRAQSERIMHHLETNPEEALELDLVFERLQVERLFCELMGEPLRYHQFLQAQYKRLESVVEMPVLLRLVNLLLKSALEVGDFLLLGSLSYATDKRLKELPEAAKPELLPAYYEQLSLFHFYEKETPKALEENAWALEWAAAGTVEHYRLTAYRYALLLGANLHLQLLEEWSRIRPASYRQDPLLNLLVLMARLDNEEPEGEILLDLDPVLKTARKDRQNKPLVEALQQLARYLEGQSLRNDPLMVFPTEWEPLLRPDLWLRAKREASFYGQLLREA